MSTAEDEITEQERAEAVSTAETLPPGWDSAESSGVTRSARRRRSSKSMSRKYATVKADLRKTRMALAVAVLALGLSWGGVFHIVMSHREDLLVMRNTINQADTRAQRVSDSMAKQKQELAALMQGRIPALRSIEFGTPVTVDLDYVRRVTFNWVVARKSPRIEYDVVLENADRDYLVPELELVIFDRRGFELHTIPVRAGAGGRTVQSMALARGDVRTLRGGLDLDSTARPAHFLVSLNGKRSFDEVGRAAQASNY
jgi:hypothetical protein